MVFLNTAMKSKPVFSKAVKKKKPWKGFRDPFKKKAASKKKRYYQGRFQPKHAEKYRGDPTRIEYRSRYELVYMTHLDRSENIVEWSSESTVLWYISPKDNLGHRYFVDMTVKKREKDGTLQTYLIEIKPMKQVMAPTKPPVMNKQKERRYLNEVLTWGVNQAKWNAARKYCQENGYKFVVITEKELKLKF